MNDWTLVAVGVAAYWALVATARARGLLPDFVGATGPLLTVHTKRGRRFLEALAAPKRFWRAWGNLGLGVAAVVMLGVFLQVLVSAITVVQVKPAPSVVNQPKNVLAIPGVNDFLPLSVAPEILFGLLVGLVVHEGGHGLLCRVGDIEIASMGVVLFTILPIGAFVEPDEEQQRAADRGARARMFAAGVTNNFFVTALAFLLLFGPVVGAISVAPGALVAGPLEQSPAKQAGIEKGDRIVAVEGTPIESNAALDDVLRQTEARTVTVTMGDGSTTTVTRSLVVSSIAQASPFWRTGTGGLEGGSRIAAVNGTDVHTRGEFWSAVGNRSFVALTNASGATVTGRVGALVTVGQRGPMQAAGFDAGTDVIVTEFAGDAIRSAEDLQTAIDSNDPGDAVTVVGYVDGERVSHTVTLGEQEDGSAYLGVYVAPGVSGLDVTDFGVQTFPAGRYLQLLGGNPDGSAFLSARMFASEVGPVGDFVRGVITSLFLPFIGTIDPTLPLNFPGFVGWNQAFYTVDPGSPLAALGGGVLLLANVLFWVGWVNLNLGFFNCIPAFPLDGGHLLRMGAEAVVSRLPIEDGRAATRAVTTSVGLLMLASLFLMIFGPQLFAALG